MSEPLSVLGSNDLSAMVFEHLLGLAAPLFEKMQARKQKVQTADDVLAHAPSAKRSPS
jgi:hypothetical protein